MLDATGKNLVCAFPAGFSAAQAGFSQPITNLIIYFIALILPFLQRSLTVTAIKCDRIQRQQRHNQSSQKQKSAHAMQSAPKRNLRLSGSGRTCCPGAVPRATALRGVEEFGLWPVPKPMGYSTRP
jgi:hypothetical protein